MIIISSSYVFQFCSLLFPIRCQKSKTKAPCPAEALKRKLILTSQRGQPQKFFTFFCFVFFFFIDLLFVVSFCYNFEIDLHSLLLLLPAAPPLIAPVEVEAVVGGRGDLARVDRAGFQIAKEDKS